MRFVLPLYLLLAIGSPLATLFVNEHLLLIVGVSVALHLAAGLAVCRKLINYGRGLGMDQAYTIVEAAEQRAIEYERADAE
jgi:hypothetical protein